MLRRVRLSRLIAATVAVAAVVVSEPGSGPQRVAAFKLDPHEQIVRTALAPFGIPPAEMDMIVGAWIDGTGNRGSDLYQFDQYRHFDSARNPSEVCQRAAVAWEVFYTAMRAYMKPRNAPEYDLIPDVYISGVLSTFGALTHSMQDFYAHSNWVELQIDSGQSPSTIPGLFPPPPCDTVSWPANLQTGYFNLRYGWDGCPDANTLVRLGFMYCHEELNKDDNNSKEGRRQVPGRPITYHQLAAQLATAHTAELYRLVVSSLERDWSLDFPDVRPDCLVKQVFQHLREPCRFGRLTVANTEPAGVPLGAGTVDVVSPSGTILATYAVSSWPPDPIQTHECLPGMTIHYDFAVVDDYPPPIERRVHGDTLLGGAGCDATLGIDPRAQLDYIMRIDNVDPNHIPFTDVVVTVNTSGMVSSGIVPADSSVWVDLGPCSTVSTIAFTVQYDDPIDGQKRTFGPGETISVGPECDARIGVRTAPN